MKDRMIAVKEQVLPGTHFVLLGQIHDEIGFAVPRKHDSIEVVRDIKSCMEDHTGHLSIEVPCEVDRVTTYWNEREEVTL